jgi:hypothetical protein
MTSRVASSVEEKKQIKVSLIMNKSRIGLTLPAGDCLPNVISLCVCPPVIIYSQPFPRIKPIDKTAFRPETVKVTILTLAKKLCRYQSYVSRKIFQANLSPSTVLEPAFGFDSFLPPHFLRSTSAISEANENVFISHRHVRNWFTSATSSSRRGAEPGVEEVLSAICLILRVYKFLRHISRSLSPRHSLSCRHFYLNIFSKHCASLEPCSPCHGEGETR